jgi:hypothetical protein
MDMLDEGTQLAKSFSFLSKVSGSKHLDPLTEKHHKSSLINFSVLQPILDHR